VNDYLEEKERRYVLGKRAGYTLRDKDTNVIVEAGQEITDEIVFKAYNKGLLHQLMLRAVASIVEAGGPEARKRLEEFKEITKGHEVEFVRGEIAAKDVIDFQGNILVRTGDKITDEVLEKAKHLGLLQELVLAVGAPGIHAY
jgi:hypothetical protein